MPLYEYACKKCGNEFEFLQRANVPAVCPRCLSHDCTKRLSRFNAGGQATEGGARAEAKPVEAACPAAHCCGAHCRH